MKKVITISILILSLISLVNAFYPGDSIEVNLNELDSYLNYSIEGNTSALNISVDNLIATIIISLDYKHGDIIEYYYGGGSSCTYNKTFNWNCSEWSECIDSKQTRICKKYNNCHNTYGKPNETQNCSVAQNISQEQNITEEKIKEIISEENFWDKYYIWLIFGVSMIVIMFIIIYFIIKEKLKGGKDKGAEDI